jgi:RNA-directed DNA polymerase
MTVSPLVIALARSFAAGAPDVEQIVARSSRTLGKPWRWLRPLAQRYLGAFADQSRPRHRDVVQFLLRDAGLRRARSRHARELQVEQWLTESPQMQPVAAAETWDIPAIESAGALADWLLLDHGELAWFAARKGLGYKSKQPRLRHYYYQIRMKRSGSIRLIEAPKLRLKRLQRQILAAILDKIPPHPAAHGFLRRRSIKTFVAPHVGQRVVLRMDLQDFFPSIAGVRIQALFRTMGYPETVADLLGGICTNTTPPDIWKDAAAGDAAWDIPPLQLREARAFYARPHLPQGAPFARHGFQAQLVLDDGCLAELGIGEFERPVGHRRKPPVKYWEYVIALVGRAIVPAAAFQAPRAG